MKVILLGDHWMTDQKFGVVELSTLKTVDYNKSLDKCKELVRSNPEKYGLLYLLKEGWELAIWDEDSSKFRIESADVCFHG